MARDRSDETVRTYRRVVDMTRAGLTVKAAAEALSDELGATPGAIAQRYYVAARELDPSRPTTPRRRSTDAAAPPPPQSPLEVDVANLLETAAAMIGEAAKGLRELERDAERWRAIRAVIDD